MIIGRVPEDPPIITKQQLLEALNKYPAPVIAAERLGICRTGVYRLIHRYGLRKVVAWK